MLDNFLSDEDKLKHDLEVGREVVVGVKDKMDGKYYRYVSYFYCRCYQLCITTTKCVQNLTTNLSPL